MPNKSRSHVPRPTPARRKQAATPKAMRRNPWTRKDGEVHGKGLSLGYARVSTLDQNLALQRDPLTEAGCEKIFIEQMSGAVAERQARLEVLDYARSGDTLVVWKLDRLARSMKQLIETVEKLRVLGVGFQSLTESIDTTTAQGVLVFHMLSALAEFQRSLIRERTRAGLAAARRVGRPRKLDDDLEVARALLANADIGVKQIADRLGASSATLYRYIPAARTANAVDN